MAISVTVLIVLSGHWWRCLSDADWLWGTDGLGRLFLEVSSSCLCKGYFNFYRSKNVGQKMFYWRYV